MQTPPSQEIIVRFFAALRHLIDDKIIRGRQTFTRRYGINRWNMCTLEKNPVSDIFQPAWLNFLVTDFKVSPLWLLTGEGPFYRDGWDAASVRQIQPKKPSKPKE